MKLGEFFSRSDLKGPTNDVETYSVSEGLGLVPQSMLFSKKIALEDRSKYRIVRPGEVVYNPFLLWAGAAAVNFSTKDVAVSPAYVVLKPHFNSEEHYWHTFFRSKQFSQKISGIAKGSVTRRRVASLDDILNLDLEIPDSGHRKNASNLIRLIQERIESLSEINRNLESVSQSIFKSWFINFDPVKAKSESQSLDYLSAGHAALFSDSFVDSELGLIPKGWKAGTFKDCCIRVESGGTPKRTVHEYWAGSIPWLTSGEVRNSIVFDTKEKITPAGVKESSAKLWPTGTTVIAMYGATAGEVCLLANPTTANQACCGLIPKDNFRAFLFVAARIERRNLSSKSTGSAQQNLNKGLVESHKIIIPTSSLLELFEKVVGSMLDSWIENDRQADLLAELHETLSSRLILGEAFMPNSNVSITL